jgi:hypothetical protein
MKETYCYTVEIIRILAENRDRVWVEKPNRHCLRVARQTASLSAETYNHEWKFFLFFLLNIIICHNA